MGKWEIVDTSDWKTMIELLQEQLAHKEQRVIAKARQGSELEIGKAVSEYDGYRQAIEFIQSKGGKNNGKSQIKQRAAA